MIARVALNAVVGAQWKGFERHFLSECRELAVQRDEVRVLLPLGSPRRLVASARVNRYVNWKQKALSSIHLVHR